MGLGRALVLGTIGFGLVWCLDRARRRPADVSLALEEAEFRAIGIEETPDGTFHLTLQIEASPKVVQTYVAERTGAISTTTGPMVRATRRRLLGLQVLEMCVSASAIGTATRLELRTRTTHGHWLDPSTGAAGWWIVEMAADARAAFPETVTTTRPQHACDGGLPPELCPTLADE